jgi:peptidyl-prolyl cis-trans isomerase SurA
MKTLKSFIIIVNILILPLNAQQQSKEQEQIIDGVAAVVADNIILKSELAQIVNMTAMQQNINPSTTPDLYLKLQNQILQSMIDQKVVLELAEKDTNVIVKDKEVDSALELQIENILAQAGSEENAEKMLGEPLRDFKREYWYDIRDRLYADKFQQLKLQSISINRTEVEDFYAAYKDSLPFIPTEVKLRHILLNLEAGEESVVKTISFLDSLRDAINSGADFAELATKYSEDPGSKNRGGDLGFTRRGTLVTEFEEVAFTLDVGEVSHPVKTAFGYHIIQPLEKQGDKVRARHILINPPVSLEDEQTAYDFAESLKDSISTIDDFIDFATRYSKDERTRENGGDLGWVNPDNFAMPEISQVIYYLEMNECSLPVKTSFGYHLLWLEGVNEGGYPSLEKNWLDIETMALNKKKMDWYQSFISDARNDYYISIKN